MTRFDLSGTTIHAIRGYLSRKPLERGRLASGEDCFSQNCLISVFFRVSDYRQMDFGEQTVGRIRLKRLRASGLTAKSLNLAHDFPPPLLPDAVRNLIHHPVRRVQTVDFVPQFDCFQFRVKPLKMVVHESLRDGLQAMGPLISLEEAFGSTVVTSGY